MSTKHTPGPWTFELDHTDGAAIVSRTGDDVARVFSLSLEGTENRATSQRETAANAHLIAAAPDLLAALQLIADSEAHNGAFVCDFDTLQSVARAAIAKAVQS